LSGYYVGKKPRRKSAGLFVCVRRKIWTARGPNIYKNENFARMFHAASEPFFPGKAHGICAVAERCKAAIGTVALVVSHLLAQMRYG
jgi:hypothetical protein